MNRIQQFRDMVLTFSALAALLIFGYREFCPKEPQADRVEVAALAYLKVQPQSLEDVAKALDAGGLKVDGIGQALKDAHTPAANDFAAALKDAGNTSSALRRAAAAMRKGKL